MDIPSINQGTLLPAETIVTATTDKKALIIVEELQSLTEQLMDSFERFATLRDQKNATGISFNTDEMNALYALTKGLEHVDGNVVNSVFSGFEGLLGYLDAVGQYRRDPLNKFRTGAS